MNRLGNVFLYKTLILSILFYMFIAGLDFIFVFDGSVQSIQYPLDNSIGLDYFVFLPVG